MTNNTTKIDYSNVSARLVEQITEVIEESYRHLYSVSKVYAAYNAAYGLNEVPQSCSTCLRSRARLLSKWMDGYIDFMKTQQAAPITVDEATNSVADPFHIQTTTGETILFTAQSSDSNKGTVQYPNGDIVTPGKYQTSTGDEITVRAKGKATIRQSK